MDINDCMLEVLKSAVYNFLWEAGEDRAGEINTHKIKINAITAVESCGISAPEGDWHSKIV